MKVATFTIALAFFILKVISMPLSEAEADDDEGEPLYVGKETHGKDMKPFSFTPEELGSFIKCWKAKIKAAAPKPGTEKSLLPKIRVGIYNDCLEFAAPRSRKVSKGGI